MVEAIRLKRRMTTEDVFALRRAVYPDGIVDVREALALFRLNDDCEAATPAWTELFIEAQADFIVHQAEPRGYVSRDNADWLIAQVGRDGVVDTARELELLVKVLEAAKDVPQRLVGFTLEQVEAAVLEGRGVLARGGTLVPGAIGEAETAMLRRILYAYGGSGAVAITRTEAEILFNLNDATIEADNAPAWSDLFVKAIASHLLAAQGFRVPSRNEALRRAAWLDSPTGLDWDGLSAGSIGSALLNGLKGVFEPTLGERVEAAYAARNADFEAQQSESERIDGDEALWVVSRIGRDGTLHENEKALLAFLRAEASHIDPKLLDLIRDAA
ncbi:MAG: hypothetical protein C0606_13850 [Hyphomicrobiales bacterium]|nr:MAG: hypothetical protein C0606_13850 [Hyphomicrobiales bacterium]